MFEYTKPNATPSHTSSSTPHTSAKHSVYHAYSFFFRSSYPQSKHLGARRPVPIQKPHSRPKMCA